MTIYKKMIDVMRGIGSIGKDRKNQMQGYNFRGIDDVYNQLHSLMAEAGIFCVSEIISERSEDRQSNKGSLLIYRVVQMRFTFFCDDGSSVQTTVIGEGMDSGDKATNKAMSVAQKYALIQSFLIPTIEAKDPENDSHDVSGNGVRVGSNTYAVVQRMREKKWNVDSFVAFLIKNKKLSEGETVNLLDDSKAKLILDNWALVETSFMKYIAEAQYDYQLKANPITA